MTFDEFETSLVEDSPPSELPVPLAALWLVARDDWNHAHRLVQSVDGTDAAWVHAHLHRVDGDDANAGYWYRRAGRPAAKGEFATERKDIATALLLATGRRDSQVLA